MELFSGYCFAQNTASRLGDFLKKRFQGKKAVFLCLGTDKVLADCMAPLLAELLRKNDFPFYIYGGLKAPITTQNAQFACDFIHTLHSNEPLIVIDSMASNNQARLGHIIVKNEYVGAVNSLNLQADIFIYGITSLLNNTMLCQSRLYTIEKVAKTISEALLQAFVPNTQIYANVQNELTLKA